VTVLALEGEETDKVLYTALAKGVDTAARVTGLGDGPSTHAVENDTIVLHKEYAGGLSARFEAEPKLVLGIQAAGRVPAAATHLQDSPSSSSTPTNTLG